MRLLLIRHGESVDNVAGLYAGSRDSPLTNHGVLQAKRLGAHIANQSATIGPVKQIFASDLERAYRTAEAVADACTLKVGGSSSSSPTLGVIRLKELREKDFGSSEGKKFGGKESNDNSETLESMRHRIDRFLGHHFSPIVDQATAENATAGVVIVVSHGIILNVVLKALLSRYPPKSTSSQRIVDQSGSEYLAPWSNTGVLQARLELSEGSTSPTPHNTHIHMMVEHTNNVDHLHGLKKTRGGIGSAKFDSRQRTMDSFFASASKKRKLNDVEDS
ncbi:phosphoglycerate mutase-like protein [Xylaria sp. CBS 124048]|nr:phosphoglycerate mutase-like protein [Xylaria sp. CBS 124048]